MTRRRFLALVGGGLGIATAGWALERSATPSAAAPIGASQLTTLPPVATPAPASLTDIAIGDGVSATSINEGRTRLIDVMCREAWGARPAIGEFTEHIPVRMTVHHTATLLTDDAAAPAHIREHQAFHQFDHGWPDLAYHFIVDGAGVVYEGRPVDAVGDTGTDYDPAGHLLVACEGNFDRQPMPAAQYETLVDLLAWGATAYDIDPDTITGHRDWTATACPGVELYTRVADGSLVEAVRARLDDEAVGLNHRCGSAGAAAVAAIEAGADPPDTQPNHNVLGGE